MQSAPEQLENVYTIINHTIPCETKVNYYGSKSEQLKTASAVITDHAPPRETIIETAFAFVDHTSPCELQSFRKIR